MLIGFKVNFPWKEPTNFKEKILAGIKIHTIRVDAPNRWKAGRIISMCYRGKNYSILDEFSKGHPELQKCTGVQIIEIKSFPDSNQKIITIDGRQLGLVEHFQLAKNDGFDDVHQFYKWFSMVEFKGKIIMWTDFRY